MGAAAEDKPVAMSGEASSAGPALAIEDLVKRYGSHRGAVTAVDHVSFDVAPGEFVSIIGPSGCGKSTLFHVIGGLTGDYEGRVNVDGETMRGPHPAIGMVFQEESTFPWRNVQDNVAFPLEVRGVKRAERLARAEHFIDLVGLRGFERHHPRSCPAACASASRSRVRWRALPKSC